jgi:hypothetical protein
MPIATGEILFKKPQEDSDATSNGGRITAAVSASDVASNDFPNVTQAELTAGKTRYRKRFVKIANDADLLAQAVKLYLRQPTAANDTVCFFPGAQRNTQNDLTGSERLYGGAPLATTVTSGAVTLVVNTEGVALNYFRNGDSILISDKGSVFNTSGNREFVTISGTPSYSGDQATITLAVGVVSGYNASSTFVASVYSAGDIKALADNYSKSSSAGTYDAATHPVVVDHIGTVEQTWTATFTSATAFGVVGDVEGSVGSGSISSDFTPANANESSKPYFTIPSTIWGGTWASGDTFIFQTHPCAVPLWFKEIVPASCAAFSDNKPWVGVMLQTA